MSSRGITVHREENPNQIMPHKSFCLLVATLIAASSAATAAYAASHPYVSPMFSDNMVMQRGKTNTVWGWDSPGRTVRVEVAGRVASATVGADGCWIAAVWLPEAGGPYTLSIAGVQRVSFTNVLIGDVWLCGGQSNMEWPLERARNGEVEVKAANHPNIRLFTVRQQPGYSQKPFVQGSWKICSPETVTEDGGVSAVGYFFARRIQSETNVPIGLIKDCWGGTPAESWTSAAALAAFPEFTAGRKEVERLRAKGAPEYGNFIEHWYEEFDPGQKGGWLGAGIDESKWQNVSIPGGFQELGVPETPAVCYFRKAITLPDPLPEGAARLHLGIIERMDTVHVNGRWTGASAWVENPRSYAIAPGVLRPGTNVIAVRVLKTKPDGGFRSKPEQIRLVLGTNEFPLAGEWKGRLSLDAKPPHPMPVGFENWPTMPAVLYNGMIAPVAPLAISGALWYQGESNVGRANQYKRLLPAMIADWRQAFGQGDFPFYIVSLAAFQQRNNLPGDDAWAELREAQAYSARAVSNSCVAMAIDVGDANDVHPRDKKEVGERLALCALAGHYGRPLTCSGPVLKSVEKLPGALKLSFNNAVGGLVVKGEKAGEFSVAGEDRNWFWAEAKVEGETVVVSSPEVNQPVFVRYAWQSNPMATLFNTNGLPAEPFRTDN